MLGPFIGGKINSFQYWFEYAQIIRFEVKVRILGVGTFGKVWLVSHKKTQVPYALKMLSKREIIGHHQVEGVIREKNIMSSIDHPFVVNLVNTFQDPKHLYMLIELVQGTL